MDNQNSLSPSFKKQVYRFLGSIFLLIVAIKIALLIRSELPGLYNGHLMDGAQAVGWFVLVTIISFIPALITLRFVKTLFIFLKQNKQSFLALTKEVFGWDEQNEFEEDHILFSTKLSETSQKQYHSALTRVTDILSNPSNDVKNILIDGKWGSGKTTFLDYLRKSIEEIRSSQAPNIKTILGPISGGEWTFIMFDPWVLHYNDDPVHSLLQKLSFHQELKDLKIQNFFKDLVQVLNGSSEKWTNIFPFLKLLISSPQILVKNIGCKLRNTHKIVIIIDNLERCSREQIERIITLVNLFAPINDVIKFILTGSQEIIENQLTSYLGLDKNKTHDEDSNYLEKLFHVIPLPYTIDIAASYFIQMLDDYSSPYAWRIDWHAMKDILLIPFFREFGTFNRRACQTNAKRLTIRIEALMTALKPSLLDPVNLDQEAQKVLEQLLVRLELIQFKQKDFISKLDEHSETLAEHFTYLSNTEPNSQTPIFKTLSEQSKLYLLSAIKSLTHDKFGRPEGETLPEISKKRLKLVLKAFKDI